MNKILLLLLTLVTSIAFGQTSKHTITQDCLRIQDGVCIDKNELGYVDGATSNLQTQINTNSTAISTNDAAAVHKTGNETIAGVKTVTGKTVATSTANGFHPCPSMTDTQMLAVVSPANGDCVHNTTLGNWYVYSTTSSTWKQAGGAGGISNWVTATAYLVNDVVIQSNKIYQAATAHTSGTFATDLAAAKWVQIANNVADATGVLPLANGGTNKSMLITNGGVAYVDSDSFELTAAGTSGQFLKSNGAGGTPAFGAVDISTSSVTGVLPLANGGTSKNMTATAGGMVYTDSDSQEVMAAGTLGQTIFSNAASAPTWSDPFVMSSTDVTSAARTKQFTFPNNQLTQTATDGVLGTMRVETGNTGLFFNPDFEATAITNGWTLDSASASTLTTNIASGLKAMRRTYTSQAVDVKQDSTLFQDTFAEGNYSATAKCNVRASAATPQLYHCPRSAGAYPSSISTTCAPITQNGKWQPLEYPMPLTGTSNGFGITSNGVAYTGTVDFDGECDLKVGKNTKTVGVIGPWQSYTPTLTGSSSNPTRATASTEVARWRQVGDTMEIQYFYTQSSATGAVAGSGSYYWSLPAGYTIDTSKISSNTGGTLVVGEARYFGGSSTAWYTGTVYPASTTQLGILGQSATSTGTSVGSTHIPITNAAAVEYSFTAKIPVTQFSGVNTIYEAPTNSAEISQVIFTSQTVAPNGFISAMNKTIGNTGADFNGNDYYALYEILWNMAGLSTTAGDVYVISSAKGTTAAADWAANKTIKIDYLTNAPFIRAAGTGRTLGSYQIDDFKSHQHVENATDLGGGFAGGGNRLLNFSSGALTGATGGTETRPKNVALNAWIRYKPFTIYGSFNEVMTKSGITKPVKYQADIDGSDNVTNENTDWLNGNCTNATTGIASCVPNTGYFASGSIVRCWTRELATSAGNDSVHCKMNAAETSSSIQVICKQAAAAINYGFTLFCEGNL